MVGFILLALLSVVSAGESMFTGDSAYVRVQASAKAIDAKDVATATAEAVAKITEACNGDTDLLAKSEAQVIAQAIATAIAQSQIVAQTSGSGTAIGQSSATAKATATAIAKAFATGLAAIKDGPAVQTATSAVAKQVATAVAKVQQEVAVTGDAEAAAAAVAKSSVLVQAIAAALALAAAECDGKEGTVSAATYTVAEELPIESETYANTASVANVFGDGQAQVLTNSALATFFEGFKKGDGKGGKGGKGGDDDDDDDDDTSKNGAFGGSSSFNNFRCKIFKSC